MFAAALAHTTATVGSTLLVDADPIGAGIDRVLGLEASDGIRWDSMLQARSAQLTVDARGTSPCRSALRADLADGPTRLAAGVCDARGALGRAAWIRDGRDRPPAASGVVVEEAITRCDHVVLVSTLTVPGVTSAARVATRLPEFSPQRHLVTRGSRAGVAPESVSRLLRMPLLAAMGDQRGLDEAINLGAGPARSRRGTLARAARTCASALLAERPAAAA